MITLINCVLPAKTAVPPPGLLSLAAAVRAAGFEVRLVDLQREGVGEEPLVPEDVSGLVPPGTRIVGFSAMSNMLPFALEAARCLRERQPDLLILFGGCGVQGSIREVMAQFEFIDFSFHGEAEETLPQFLRAWNNGGAWGKINGLAYRGNSGIEVTPAPVRLQDLDQLPRPAYDLVDLAAYQAPVALMRSRGCPFRCSYCEGSAFRRDRVTYRSSGSILEEVGHLETTHGLKRFSFVDDTFTASRRRALEFCEAYRRQGRDFDWAAMVRVDTLDAEVLGAMADAHCRALYFGVESGSERVLEQIRKGFRPASVVTVLGQARQLFGGVVASFIWGFPFETVADLEETLLLASELRLMGVEVQLHLWAPMPRSPLFEVYRDQLVFDPAVQSNIVSGDLERYGSIIRSSARVFAPFYHVPHADFAAKRETIKAFGFVG